MNYRKYSAEKIFDGYKFLTDHVLITTGDGMIKDVLSTTDAGDGVEFIDGMLTPGFINCHCHLELSHMKGLIPRGTGLVDFVFKVVTERHHSDDEILDAIERGENEMIANGIVAVGDICNNTLTIPQKINARIRYYNFIEASGWLPGVSAQRFKMSKEIYEAFEEVARYTLHAARGRTANSIVPHAPYSVSANLWSHIQDFFEDKVVSIHNQETAFEDEFFLEGTGDFQRMYQLMKIDNSHHEPTKKTSLQSYFNKLKKAANILLVHNTFTRSEDVQYVKRESSIVNRESLIAQPQTSNVKPQTFFCLCPNANLYIENKMPPVNLFRTNDCNIVLGTDSLASNWSLSVLDEIKSIQKNFPEIQLEEMLMWATSNGAKALQMDDELGSFEPGKKPGVLNLKNGREGLSVVRIQ